MRTKNLIISLLHGNFLQCIGLFTFILLLVIDDIAVWFNNNNPFFLGRGIPGVGLLDNGITVVFMSTYERTKIIAKHTRTHTNTFNLNVLLFLKIKHIYQLTAIF